MPNIHQALVIGATAEKVYNAITTQEGLAAWWAPDATAKAEVNSIARFPFGPNYYKDMKITALKPFELIEWHCMKGDDQWVGTTLSFTLKPGNAKDLLKAHPEITGQVEQQSNKNITLLIFHHDDWKDYTLMFAECSYTWGQFLKSLKAFCETGKGMPWPYQHQLHS